jgi:hypothetical protein
VYAHGFFNPEVTVKKWGALYVVWLDGFDVRLDMAHESGFVKTLNIGDNTAVDRATQSRMIPRLKPLWVGGAL